MSDIEFSRFVRTPFVVEAVVITDENIDEIAALIGEVKTKGDDKYIALDRRVVPNVSRAYKGWYFTRLDDNYRCYSPKVFAAQFMAVPESNVVTFNLNEAFTTPADDSERIELAVDVV